jgi:hypothetical protein
VRLLIDKVPPNSRKGSLPHSVFHFGTSTQLVPSTGCLITGETQMNLGVGMRVYPKRRRYSWFASSPWIRLERGRGHTGPK